MSHIISSVVIQLVLAGVWVLCIAIGATNIYDAHKKRRTHRGHSDLIEARSKYVYGCGLIVYATMMWVVEVLLLTYPAGLDSPAGWSRVLLIVIMSTAAYFLILAPGLWMMKRSTKMAESEQLEVDSIKDNLEF